MLPCHKHSSLALHEIALKAHRAGTAAQCDCTVARRPVHGPVSGWRTCAHRSPAAAQPPAGAPKAACQMLSEWRCCTQVGPPCTCTCTMPGSQCSPEQLSTRKLTHHAHGDGAVVVAAHLDAVGKCLLRLLAVPNLHTAVRVVGAPRGPAAQHIAQHTSAAAAEESTFTDITGSTVVIT